MSLYHKYEGPIDVWHILISGFRQDKAEPNGMEELWVAARTYSKPGVCVQYHAWDEDWAAVAKFMSRNSNEDTTVNIYAYSWGAGWGFVRLAKALAKEGLTVRLAVLCDPVSRTPYLPTWLPLNPLSLTRGRKIPVPANVREVQWLRQRVNKPCGHLPVGEHTLVHKPIELKVPHNRMEDSPEFHRMVMDNVTRK